MYIFKNSLKSISRNKGRNILIGIIIIVISCACAVTLSILNAANKIVSSYEEKYQIKASIGMNREKLVESFKESSSGEDMINSFNNIESVTKEEIEKYADSKYVSSYYYTYTLNMNSSNLKEATDSLVKETTTTTTRTETFGGGNYPGRPGGNYGGKRSTTTTKKTEEIKNLKAENGAFKLIGYNSYEAMTDFINGSYTITSGEVSSDFESNTCVISEELASLNNIEVGDTITLTSPKDSKITYELTVSGIYKENTEDSDDMTNMFSASVNDIITNSNVIENILALSDDLDAELNPTFILTSSDVVDKFSEEVTGKGLSEYYQVTNNLSEVESATESINNVKTFATTFLIITLIIGGVVLFVINMINIRERKYEIGVLRTIGMSKFKVISEFVIELLVVTIFGLIIGAGIGSLSSVKIANSLLENEIQNSTSNVEKINSNFGGHMFGEGGPQNKINGLVTIEKADSINAVVDIKVLGELLLIGVGLTFISSLASMISIQRFSPLEILRERS